MKKPSEKPVFRNSAGESFIPSSIQVTDDMSLPALYRWKSEEEPDKTIIKTKNADGSWNSITWRQFREDYLSLARGLVRAGLQPGDRYAIMAHTGYEFVVVDFAVWAAGGLLVPIYQTDSPEQIMWIIEDSRCRGGFAEDGLMAEEMQPAVGQFDFFERIASVSPESLRELSVPADAEGAAELDAEINRRIDATRADDPATIIYTSGTTGRSKGSIITHRNFLHVVLNGPLDMDLGEVVRGRSTLLFLPLAHVFARFINLLCLYSGRYIGYVSDFSTVLDDVQSFQPEYLLLVPRVLEKIYTAADTRVSGAQQKILRHYAQVAVDYSKALETEEGPSAALRAQHALGDKLVYAKIRELMGPRLRYIVSGGAALGQRLGHFYRGVGFTVLEGYGATETTAPTTVNRTDYQKIGSTGPAYPGTRVRTAEDGEILVKGDHVFAGYLNNDEETKKVFTDDGWLRTGDLGEIDADGWVWITGRKKDIIVTAGGKNVAPAPLEERLQGYPLVSQVVVLGDGRPFISALITLDETALPAWLKSKGLPEMSVAEARKNPDVIAALDAAIKRANRGVSRAESIRRFSILPEDFSVNNGRMTASAKVKRNVVLRDYSDLIDALYNRAEGEDV